MRRGRSCPGGGGTERCRGRRRWRRHDCAWSHPSPAAPWQAMQLRTPPQQRRWMLMRVVVDGCPHRRTPPGRPLIRVSTLWRSATPLSAPLHDVAKTTTRATRGHSETALIISIHLHRPLIHRCSPLSRCACAPGFVFWPVTLDLVFSFPRLNSLADASPSALADQYM